MSSQAKPWLRGVVFDLDGTLTAPRKHFAVIATAWRGAELGFQSDARTLWGARRTRYPTGGGGDAGCRTAPGGGDHRGRPVGSQTKVLGR